MRFAAHIRDWLRHWLFSDSMLILDERLEEAQPEILEAQEAHAIDDPRHYACEHCGGKRFVFARKDGTAFRAGDNYVDLTEADIYGKCLQCEALVSPDRLRAWKVLQRRMTP